MSFTIDDIQIAVTEAVKEFNSSPDSLDRVASVSLFGSYAKGTANSKSDVDLLVTFTSAVVSLFTMARLLSCLEKKLGTPVDIVQNPIPADSLLKIEKVVPLYEAI